MLPEEERWTERARIWAAIVGDASTKKTPLKVPVVIRLTGTNEEIAVKILKDNGYTAMTDMDAAVRTIAGSARSMGIEVEGVR